MLYQDMAGEAQPPFTAESLGKPLLLNSHVRDFLTGFPMQDWPKVVEVGLTKYPFVRFGCIYLYSILNDA
jgi:hypothetical protein